MTDREGKWTRDQRIAAIAAGAGVVGTAVNFIRPVTDALGPYYWVAQPFLFIGLGAFIGFSAARALDSRRLTSLETELERRPTQGQVAELEARLSEVAATIDRAVSDLARVGEPSREITALEIDDALGREHDEGSYRFMCEFLGERVEELEGGIAAALPSLSGASEALRGPGADEEGARA